MADNTLAGLTRQALRVRGTVRYRQMPEAATQTFKAGDLITADSASRISIAATSGNDLASTGDVLYGRALQDASGTTDTSIWCEQWLTDTEIALPVFHATAASAVTAATLVGDVYVLTNEATGGWVISIDTATNPILQITEIADSYDGGRHAVGDQYAPVWCRVFRAELAGQSDAVWA